MLNLDKKFINSKGGNIFYLTNKLDSARPTVIFLHGLSSNHTTWNYLAEQLMQKGFNCLMLDIRGHGYSDKSKNRNLYKFYVFEEDLEKIIVAENITSAYIVGYSFGSYIAMNFAIKNPQVTKGLVLASPNHVNPWRYKWYSFFTRPGYIILQIVALMFLWQKRKNYYYFEQDSAKNYWQSTFTGFTTMPISINLWMLSEIGNLNLGDSIRKIVCPTLILHSHNDPFVTEKEIIEMKSKIKNCQTVELGSGHFLGSMFQKEIAEHAINFLNQQT